jgi:hypothetical protein
MNTYFPGHSSTLAFMLFHFEPDNPDQGLKTPWNPISNPISRNRITIHEEMNKTWNQEYNQYVNV